MTDDRLAATLEALLREPKTLGHHSLEEWKRDYPALCREHPEPVELAIVGGFRANCAGYAFMAGYQAALRGLISQIPTEGLCAVCVTEAEGNHPRVIHTTLSPVGDGYVLNGAKSFVTGGTLADTLLVAARTGASGGRPVIKMLWIDGNAAGVTRTPMPSLDFVPEIVHASVQFDGVAVDANALLPGDGYADYVKPFRTVEDCHVSLAVTGYLMRITLELGAPPHLAEAALACLAAHTRLATLDFASPATHLALAGARRQLQGLVSMLEEYWREADPVTFALWERDRRLLEVAGAARNQRLARAREQLLGLPSR